MSFGGISSEINSKKVSEAGFVTADFTSVMAFGEIISLKQVVATVYSGTDPNPAAILSGVATHAGKVVSQMVVGGVLGVIYELAFRITTGSGQILHQTKYLAVTPGLT